jgi:hypothetical protein
MVKNFLFVAAIFAFTASYSQSKNMPDGRESAHFFFDPRTKSLLLFDGYQIHLDSTENDVWRWDGLWWSQITAYGPGSRSLSAAAQNSRSNNVYLFAGLGKGNYEDMKSDLWEFDGEKWKLLSINPIGTRDHHEMVYADHMDSFIVYGGLDSRRVYDSTTWVLKNNRFTPHIIPGPGARYHFAMAYDKARKVVVLYGGGKENRRDELWEFDGTKWSKIIQENNPGKKIWHSMIYDENRKTVLLHGGDSSGMTWSWNGKEWKVVAQNGPMGLLIALGYDANRKTVVAYGGGGENNTLLSELWELQSQKWTRVSENGRWQWIEGKLKKLEQ